MLYLLNFDLNKLFRCIQYKYPSIEQFLPIVIASTSESIPAVDINSLKSFTNSYPRPFLAGKLKNKVKILEII